MNIKISQLTELPSVQSSDIIPMVRNGSTFTLSAGSIFDFANGNLSQSVYTTVNSNSSSYQNAVNTANTLYTSYQQVSGNFITTAGNQIINNDLTIGNDLIVDNTINAIGDVQCNNLRAQSYVYDANGNSENWNAAYTFASNNSDLRQLITNNQSTVTELSGKSITSDITAYSTATQIKNMIAITQAEFDTITPDPSTFYIII
jgi:hypothetical protein